MFLHRVSSASRAIPLVLALTTALFFSCAGVPSSIPEDLSAQSLIQKAQESIDIYNYAGAKAYYQTLAERYGTDAKYAMTAKYELAFIDYKQNKVAEAETAFKEIVSMYESGAAADAPKSFLTLSTLLLDKIAKLKPAAKKEGT